MSNIIVKAFSPRNVVGCLLKKGLQRGGHGHPRIPLATPLYIVTSKPASLDINTLAIVLFVVKSRGYFLFSLH